MRRETASIHRVELVELLNTAYQLGVTTLAFVPRGEVSYSYVGETQSGTRYWVKVTPVERAEDLDTRLRAAYELRWTTGLQQVVAPRPGSDGELRYEYGSFVVSVYDFVDAAQMSETDVAADELARVGALLAHLHNSNVSHAMASLPRETFQLPFEAQLRRVLASAGDPGHAANVVRRRLQEALLLHHDVVVATIAKIDQLREVISSLDILWAVTHGDPTPGNVLMDRAGNLYLIDWDDLALGPRERDLVYFTDDRGPDAWFAIVLRQYMAAAGSQRPRRFHREIFAFYIYRWILQEIAGFGARIFFGDGDPTDDEHSWAELSQYLPIDHGEIEAALDVIERTTQAEGFCWSQPGSTMTDLKERARG